VRASRYSRGSAILAFALSSGASAGELRLNGWAGAEARIFTQTAADPQQHGTQGSLSLQPEWSWVSDDGSDTVVVTPFLRLDQADHRRTHGDVREFLWIHAEQDWELRAGIGKVFWGVAESNHLVDIINQTDLVENPDTEDKLGQPMVNLALIREWGTLDLFVLPGFRARTFPGISGRLRTLPRVDTSSATYESAAEEKHVDFAVRYSHTVGELELGLHHFHGTSREPEFRAKRNGPAESATAPWVLAPHYAIIDQTGLDALYVWGNLSLKLEAFHRAGQQEDFAAAVAGFEYTWVGPLMERFGLPWDLGLLGEYHTDERGENMPGPFNDDLFIGARVSANDAADTKVLAGLVRDLGGDGNFLNVEASRRFGERWVLESELRVFWGTGETDPLRFVERDDYLQLSLNRYF
jgi:hypothetical protein